MKVINLTPHYVNICDDNGTIVKAYKPSGKVARVRHGWSTIEYADGVPLVIRVGEHIVDLPDEQEDTICIVSNIVLGECPDRMDLVAPCKQVKVNGRVVGCQAFVSNRGKS